MPQPLDQVYTTLQEALYDALKLDELKRLARLLDKPAVGRKDQIVPGILEEMKGGRLRALWNQLDELQQAAVAEAVHGDGSFPTDQFRSKYGGSPDWGSLSSYPRDARPTLMHLFFFGSRYGGPLRIPDDLKKRLESFVPEPRQAEVQTISELPERFAPPRPRPHYGAHGDKPAEPPVPVEKRLMERAAKDDLRAVLSLIDAGKISVGEGTGHPSASSIARLQTVLHGGDFYSIEVDQTTSRWRRRDQTVGPIRAFAWPLIAQAAGLARKRGAKLELTRKGKDALLRSPAATLQEAWEKWVYDSPHDELRRIDKIKGQSGRGRRGLTDPAERRAAIAEALAGCPCGRWVAVEEFLRFVRASGSDFQITQGGEAWSLYFAERHYGSLGYENHGRWEILQGRYALCFLFEYAATLGVIDVAYIPPAGARYDYGDIWGADEFSFLSRYDGLLFIRLTPLGAECLNIEVDREQMPSEEEETRPLLRVLPNLDVVVLVESLPVAERHMLDLFAAPTGEATWRLDRQRILEAAASGHPVQDLRDFLAARAAGELPETVASLLAEAERRAGALIDRGETRLYECADADLAALIAADRRTGRYCAAAGGRFVVVPARARARFLSALRHLGYGVAPERAAREPRDSAGAVQAETIQ